MKTKRGIDEEASNHPLSSSTLLLLLLLLHPSSSSFFARAKREIPTIAFFPNFEITKFLPFYRIVGRIARKYFINRFRSLGKRLRDVSIFLRTNPFWVRISKVRTNERSWNYYKSSIDIWFEKFLEKFFFFFCVVKKRFGRIRWVSIRTR